MNRKLLVAALVAVPLLAKWLSGEDLAQRGIAQRTLVTSGTLVVSSLYDGKLDTVRSAVVMSPLKGNATIVELAPEGARVKKGDLLVRFDASALERDILKLSRDEALAQAALDKLAHATLPLELREIENKLAKARTSLSAEERYLLAIAPFTKENVVSAEEVAQERLKVEELRESVSGLLEELTLTKNFVHPAELKEAHAKLASAEQEQSLARGQLTNALVVAPIDGVVVYKPISVGNEFRTVRVGDMVVPSQPFLVMPDMRELVVHLEVPEAELERVHKDADVFLKPLAFPELKLRGRVQSVGNVALTLPGLPDWQKYFHVVVALLDLDPRLAPGMSVSAEVVSSQHPNAVLAPRAAVRFQGGKPFARMASGEQRGLKVGAADALRYEVLEGLKVGDEVEVGE